MENLLRIELHNIIDKVPEEKLQEVYELLHDSEYSDEMKMMLDNEYDDYLKTGNVIIKKEVDKIINELLYKKD